MRCHCIAGKDQLLGSGSFANVFKGINRNTQELVAIKVQRSAILSPEAGPHCRLQVVDKQKVTFATSSTRMVSIEDVRAPFVVYSCLMVFMVLSGVHYSQAVIAFWHSEGVRCKAAQIPVWRVTGVTGLRHKDQFVHCA